MTQESSASLARAIHADRFSVGSPRSAAYKAGALAKLQKLTGEHATTGECPYELGTAESDAWYCGCDHGNNMFEMHELRQREAAEKGVMP